MKKIITTVLILSLILLAPTPAFAADKTAGPASGEKSFSAEDAIPAVIPSDGERAFPSVNAISTVFSRGGLEAEEEQQSSRVIVSDAPVTSVIGESNSSVRADMPDPYTIPGGVIEATEEDMRKSEEAKQRIPAETQPARVVYISDAPLTPVIGERSSSVRAEVSDRYTIPGGAIEATEEDMRKSEEAKQRIPAEAQPARRVIISDAPVPPVIGEKQTEESLTERLYEEGIMPRSFWYSLDMYCYWQEEERSCGPACARTVLRYFTGNSYEEETIRENTNYDSQWGIGLSDLVDYINAELDREEYWTHFRESEERMRDCIYSAIANYAKPVIIGVIPKEIEGSPYDGKAGHFLTVYGCTSDKTQVAVFDPWAGYIDDVIDNYFYLLDMDNLYKGYKANNSGYAS